MSSGPVRRFLETLQNHLAAPYRLDESMAFAVGEAAFYFQLRSASATVSLKHLLDLLHVIQVPCFYG